jgi:hypothetical protein
MKNTSLFLAAMLIMAIASSLSMGQGLALNGYEIGVAGGSFKLNSDKYPSSTGFHSELLVQKPLNNNLSISLAGGIARQNFQVLSKDYTTALTYGSVEMQHDFMPANRISPFALFAVEALNFNMDGGPRYWDLGAGLGAGLNLRLSPKVKLFISGAYHLTSGDDFDFYQDNIKDKFFAIKSGLAFHFTGSEQYFDEEMLQPTADTNIDMFADSKPSPAAANAEKEQLKILLQRITSLQGQLQQADRTKSELEKAIRNSDVLIKDLEFKLTEKKK